MPWVKGKPTRGKYSETTESGMLLGRQKNRKAATARSAIRDAPAWRSGDFSDFSLVLFVSRQGNVAQRVLRRRVHGRWNKLANRRLLPRLASQNRDSESPRPLDGAVVEVE